MDAILSFYAINFFLWVVGAYTPQPDRFPRGFGASARPSAGGSLFRPTKERIAEKLKALAKTYQQCQQQRDSTREERGVAFCLPDTVDSHGAKGDAR
jgi:hypothetical protein